MKKFSIAESTNNYLAQIAVLIVFVSLTIGMSVFPFFDNQESVNVLVAREMVKTGNWLVPAHPIPPMQAWIMGFSMKMFGLSEWSMRLPSVFFMLLTHLMFFFHVNRFDRRLGIASLVVLASNIAVGLLAKVSLHYAPLLFFSTGAIIAIHRFLMYGSKGWLWLMGFMLAMGLLIEGPAILIFFVIFCLLILFLHGKGGKLLNFHFFLNLFLAIVPACIWALYVFRADEYFLWALLEEHSFRWSFSDKSSLPFFTQIELVLLLLAFLPFAVFVPRAIWRTVSLSVRRNAPKQFFALWAIAAWLPYIVMGGKVAGLSVLSFPALAVIIGSLVIDWSRQVKKFALLFAPLVQIGVAIVASLIVFLVVGFKMESGRWLWFVFPGLVLVGLPSLMLIRLRENNARQKFRKWIIYGLLAPLFCWAFVPFAFRGHWGIFKDTVKNARTHKVIHVDRQLVEEYNSLSVYLEKHFSDRYYLIEVKDLEQIKPTFFLFSPRNKSQVMLPSECKEAAISGSGRRAEICISLSE